MHRTHPYLKTGSHYVLLVLVRQTTEFSSSSSDTKFSGSVSLWVSVIGRSLVSAISCDRHPALGRFKSECSVIPWFEFYPIPDHQVMATSKTEKFQLHVPSLEELCKGKMMTSMLFVRFICTQLLLNTVNLCFFFCKAA